jgi:hypothetical protein
VSTGVDIPGEDGLEGVWTVCPAAYGGPSEVPWEFETRHRNGANNSDAARSGTIRDFSCFADECE